MSGNPAPSFSYTPELQLRDRAMRRFAAYGSLFKQVWLHDKNGQRMQDIPMRSSFESFVTEIAHGLRRQITYRKDGGRFARGLVVANGTLRTCHDEFLKLEIKEGDAVPMRIRMSRQNAPIGERDALELVFDVFYKKKRHMGFTPDIVEGDAIKVRDEREAIWLEAIFEARRQIDTLKFQRDRILVDRLLDFLLDKGFHRIDEIWVFNGRLDRYLRADSKTADREFGSGITKAWINTPLPTVYNKILPLRDNPEALGREMLGQMNALARQIDTTLRIANDIERRQITIPRTVVPLGGLLSGGKDRLARPITGFSKPKVIKSLWWLRDTEDPHLLAPYRIMRDITLDNYMGTYQ